MTKLLRRLLAGLEPIAAGPWFAAEGLEAMAAAGFPGWRSYFCSRAAPLGRVPVETVVATFYNWNPEMVRRELVWDGGGPAEARAAHEQGAARLFARVTGGSPPSGVERAAEILREAAQAAPVQGRPLFAAFAALPWPQDPLLSLWHGAMLLREFRGDTHTAILVSHGVTPIEALALNAAWIRADFERYLGARGWSLEDAEPHLEHLRSRAFVDADGHVTEGGMKFREMIEMDTDRRACAPTEAIGLDATEEALKVIEPLASRFHEERVVPGIVARVAGPHA